MAEKDLVLEIDRLRHRAKNGSVQHGKRPKTQTGAVDTFIKDLEDECDYWKSQVSDLQQLLRSKSGVSGITMSQSSTTATSATRSRSLSSSPTRRTSQTTHGTSPTRGKTVSRATSPVSPAKKVTSIELLQKYMICLHIDHYHYKYLTVCLSLLYTFPFSMPLSYI